MPEYKSYLPEKIKLALEAIKKSGTAIRRASLQYGVPESTLRSRLKKADPFTAVAGTSTYFSQAEEQHLANHCVKMAHLGNGYQCWQVLELAKNMCIGKGVDSSIGTMGFCQGTVN